MHVALPGHSLRQMNRLPACGGCPTVQRCEIGSVYPAHHTAPCVRIDGFVEVQAGDGRRDERTGHALTVERHAGPVEEVVQPVVGPAETTVRRPDVGRQPVVERVGVADSAAAPLAYPP